MQGSLRLHLRRHAAVARAADDQRVRRGNRRRRAGADRVPLAARPRAAREHARDGAREPEPARRDHRDPADDVRQPRHALARGRRDPARELRRPRLQHTDPQDDQIRRGARQGHRPCLPTSRPARPRTCIAISRRRCSVARNRASMREGPLAELFRATEAAQKQGKGKRRTTHSSSCRPSRSRLKSRLRRRRSAPSRPHRSEPEPEEPPRASGRALARSASRPACPARACARHRVVPRRRCASSASAAPA